MALDGVGRRDCRHRVRIRTGADRGDGGLMAGHSDVSCGICREEFANVPDLWDHRDRKHPGWYKERLQRDRHSQAVHDG